MPQKPQSAKAQNKAAPAAGKLRCAGAACDGPTGEQLSSTVGQMVPNRPLSEEHDEEVAVHELRAEAVVLAVKMRTSVAPGHPRWTGQSVQHPDDGTECRGEVR